MAELNRINDAIYQAAIGKFEKEASRCDDGSDDAGTSSRNNVDQEAPKSDVSYESDNDETITHRGMMLLDARPAHRTSPIRRTSKF